MYGVAASMIRRGVNTDAPWLPAGAVAYMDFTQGHYYANGVASVTSLIGNIDTSYITASGVYINVAGSINHTLVASGALASVLADTLTGGGLTVIMEIQTDASPGLKPLGTVVHFENAGATVEVTATVDDASGVIIYTPENTLVAGGQTVYNGPDLNKYAMTLGRDIGGGSLQWSASNNGGATYSMTTVEDYSAVDFTTIGIGQGGGFALEYANVRSLTFYPAVDPSELPALSSLPTA